MSCWVVCDGLHDMVFKKKKKGVFGQSCHMGHLPHMQRNTWAWHQKACQCPDSWQPPGCAVPWSHRLDIAREEPILLRLQVHPQ